MILLKMRKLAALVITGTLVFGFGLQAASIAGEAAETQAIVEHSAYLRTAPKLSATKIELVNRGERLAVLNTENQYWQKVRTEDGTVGYITTNTYYVKPIPASETSTPDQPIPSTPGAPDNSQGGTDTPLELRRSLKKGDTGEDVKQVQTLLSQAGYYSAKIDGNFGSLTYEAVVKFQKQYQLLVDGVVGNQTFNKLLEVMPAQPTPDKGAGDGTQVNVTTKILGKGTSWETPVYIIKGAKPGPTVWVSGGMHGNEPAGFKAALQVKDWKIDKGTLILIPELNKVGIEKNRRDSGYGDLNRAFPQKTSESPDNIQAKAIWNEYLTFKPDYLLDLHEGYDYNVQNSNSVGQSIIYYPSGNMKTYADALVSELNKSTSSSKRFNVLCYPIGGSLARAAGVFGTPSAIFETSTKDPLSTRIQNQLTAVKMLLNHAGINLGASSLSQTS